MKLPVKSALFLTALVAALVGGLYAALQTTVLSGFASAEQAAAREDVKRVRGVISVLEDDFAQKQCPDYAYWTELATFAGGGGEEGWAEANLTVEGFRGLGWAFVAVFGFPERSAPVERFGVLLPEGGDGGQPLSAALRGLIHGQLLAGGAEHAPPMVGLARVDGVFYLVASLPTMTNERTRPPVPGRFIAATRVDATWLSRLERYAALELTLLPVADGPPPDAEAARALASLRAGADAVSDAGRGARLRSFTLVPGLDGAPLALLIAEQPRTSSALGAQVVRTSVLAVVVGGALLLVLAAWFLRSVVIAPVSALLSGVRRLESGDHARVAVRGDDELAELSTAFNHMADTLVRRQADLDEALRELWGEMDLARRIQTALLPPSPHVADFVVAAEMQTATEVGGDYYDVIDSPTGSWLAVGDVSGHGVTAGLVMMMAHTAIRTAILHESAGSPDPSPSRVLVAANRVLLEAVNRLETDKYMTISLLRRAGPGRFIHAGLHLDILVYRRAQGVVEQVETRGMWLAITPDIEDHLRDHEFEVGIGDVVVLYTDGVTEARRPGECFGVERLCAVVQRSAAAGGAEAVRAAILAAIADGWERPDDVAVVVLERGEVAVG